ncbi:MAG: hypothetical protein GF313_12935, partial [Caldithrix sp.]|nr:hypothetical protein [Caldithrix sp.]
MRNLVILIITVCIFVSPVGADEPLTYELEDIFTAKIPRMERLNQAQWHPDGESYVFVKPDTTDNIKSLYRHDVQTGEETLWIDGNKFVHPETGESIRFSDYTITDSGEKIMLKAEARRVWRRFSLARFYVYDISDQSVTAVYGGDERISHAKLSPDEQKAGYVLDNNIFIKDLESGQVTQVTSDGSDTIINGQFDWVYEEEFGIADGWRWSPDGQKMAFWRFDQSEVPTFSWTVFSPANGNVKTIRYPKAGDTNSTVRIGVYHLENEQTVWMDSGEESDIYIPRIQWTNDSDILSIQRLNRLQNRLELLLADAYSGQSETVFVDSDTCWVDVDDDLIFLEEQEAFLFTSERSGYNHIYKIAMDGSSVEPITSGKWVVKNIYGVDEDADAIYFSANKDAVTETHVFKITSDGRDLQKLTTIPGSHSARFSTDMDYFIHRYSSLNTPTQISLRDANGTLQNKLIQNALPDSVKPNLAIPDLITFRTSDGTTINARITKPKNFDPQKTYPVLIYGYGGPGSQLVRNSWGRST